MRRKTVKRLLVLGPVIAATHAEEFSYIAKRSSISAGI